MKTIRASNKPETATPAPLNMVALEKLLMGQSLATVLSFAASYAASLPVQS